MSTQETQFRNNIIAATIAARGEISTLQERIHKTVLLETARFVFIYKQASIVNEVLNILSEEKGFRVEAVAYWFKDIAGIPCDYSESRKWHGARLAKEEYRSNNGVPFTYDKEHLNYCRKESLRFWKVAPVVIKELKLADLDKVTSSAEIQLARLLSVGAIDEDKAQSFINGMMDRVKEALNSKSVKKWTADYIAQSKPEISDTEKEIMEELNIDLLKA